MPNSSKAIKRFLELEKKLLLPLFSLFFICQAIPQQTSIKTFRNCGPESLTAAAKDKVGLPPPLQTFPARISCKGFLQRFRAQPGIILSWRRRQRQQQARL